MSSRSPVAKADPSSVSPSHATDRILLAGGGARTLDLLRLATIRSDDVVLIAPHIDAAARRYAERFAVEWIARDAVEEDVAGFATVLVAIDGIADANRLVRAARRARVPVHVSDRPLVSDFSLLAFLEGSTASSSAT